MAAFSSRVTPGFRIHLGKVVKRGTQNTSGNEDRQQFVLLCQVEMQLINSFSDSYMGEEEEELFHDA